MVIQIIKFNLKIMKTKYLISRITTVCLSLLLVIIVGCANEKPDTLFIKKAEILDIKRDDDGDYQLLVRFEDSTIISCADVRCCIKMGNHKKSYAIFPFVNFDDNHKMINAPAWGYNPTPYRYLCINVYLPYGSKIPLFVD